MARRIALCSLAVVLLTWFVSHGLPTRPSATGAWITPALAPTAEADDPCPTVAGTDTPAKLARAATDKWALWTEGPYLRGASIHQRRVYPELDGPTFLGPGPVGPPYTKRDFDRLAALGADYVNISHPGPFAENLPFILDTDV